jgi:asparagine synthase (glutamine-hydrolysing)
MYWRHTFTDDDKMKIFRGADRFNQTADYFRRLWDSNDFDDGLNKISLIDLRHFFVDDLMVKNDRMFLAHSIESRFPMMDKILFDYVSRLPAKYRIKGFKTRWIEKEAMRGCLPDEILKRPSFGLEMPHSIWLTSKLRPLAEKYLNKKSVEKTGLLVWTEVEKIWLDHLSGKRDNGRALWSVMMFIIWFELFIETSDYKKYLRK